MILKFKNNFLASTINNAKNILFKSTTPDMSAKNIQDALDYMYDTYGNDYIVESGTITNTTYTKTYYERYASGIQLIYGHSNMTYDNVNVCHGTVTFTAKPFINSNYAVLGTRNQNYNNTSGQSINLKIENKAINSFIGWMHSEPGEVYSGSVHVYYWSFLAIGRWK